MPTRHLLIVNARKTEPTNPDADASQVQARDDSRDGPAESETESLPELMSLGKRRGVLEKLRDFNTAPESSDGDFLWGPGFTVEMPLTDDSISQLLVNLIDEDVAWPVLTRVCRTLHWSLMDPDSGRILTFV